MDAPSATEPFRFSVDAHGGASAATGADDTLARETRREIQRLVREVSALCHSRTPQARFWPQFLGLVGAALASEGGVLWRRSGREWASEAHVGAVDPRILSPSDSPCAHQRLVAEVGSTASPVIVPPGAEWESEDPGNPTDLLAALVPIPVDPDEPVQWILEQWLPPGGGPATLRGYLRFVAQMADLAAEYLRAERLRNIRSRADWSLRLEAFLANLYAATDSRTLDRVIVDGVAELVVAERVSLVRMQGGRGQAISTSGIADVDPRSEAVQRIVACAGEVDSVPGFYPALRPPAAGAETGAWESQSTESLAIGDADEVPRGSSDETPRDRVVHSGTLIPRGVAVIGADAIHRLVVEDLPEASADAADEAYRWSPLLRHVELALQRQSAARSSTLGRWFARSSAATGGAPGPARRALMWSGVAACLGLAALLPFPMTVTAAGRLEPTAARTVYAPHDGIITELLVEHGGTVAAGDPLLKIRDARLERNLHSLRARGAALEESIRDLERQLVRDGSRDRERAERLQTELALARDQRTAAEVELRILEDQADAMLVRAPCAGVVDAWQVRQRLNQRPIARGQTLMRVIDPAAGWDIQAEVPQNRLDSVLVARQRGDLRVEVVFHAFPTESFAAEVVEIGPVIAAAAEGASASIARVSLEDERALAREQTLALAQAGAPVDVAMRCGSRPLGYLACQDAVRTVQRLIRLYW